MQKNLDLMMFILMMNIKIRLKYTVYFDSFGIEHIPKEINKFINNDIKSNIFRIQAYDSIMGGYFCIEFIKVKHY